MPSQLFVQPFVKPCCKSDHSIHILNILSQIMIFIQNIPLIKFTHWSHKLFHWHSCSIGRLWHRWCGNKEGKLLDSYFVSGDNVAASFKPYLNHRPSINFTFWSLMLSPSQTSRSQTYIVLMSDLCHTRSPNGNTLIKIKYEHVIAFLSRWASYELRCWDQALSWLYNGSRKMILTLK